MSPAGGKSGRPGRPVAPDEAELWNRVASSVEKVKGKARVPSHAADVAPPPPAPPPIRAKSEVRPAQRLSSPAPSAPKQPPPPPALAEFDRRVLRQIASGKTPIDARLDLHGLRQRDAHADLRAFLRAAQAKGCKTVLIITGKGEAAAERDHLARAMGQPQRGVLRNSVPQWLEEPDLRSIVLGYANAGARHGGAGALYVQLRKASRT